MNSIQIYKANEILENRYYQVPQELFENKLYKDKLTSDSKILYAFLLDRLTLSKKNNWINEKGEVYLIFTRQEVQDKLNLSDKTVSKAFKQLTDARLVYEKRQGLGKPNLLFVGKIQHEKIVQIADTEILRFQTRKNYDSGVVENTITDTENLRVINTNNINTDRTSLILSNQEPEIEIREDEDSYEELFKRNIEYDILVGDPHNKKLVENITNIAVEAINSNKPTLYINSEPKSKELVKSQLLKLKPNHIEYVINCLRQNMKDVKSLKSYILTTLYNSINTIEIDATLVVAKIMNE